MQKKHYLMLLLAPLFGVLLVCLQVFYTANIVKYTGPEVVFQIKANEPFSSINGRLHKEGLIASARLFHRYSQFKGTMSKFKAGRYIIPPNTNLIQVYNILMFDKSLSTSFTISEGKNMYEIAAMLSERSITNYAEFIELAKDQEFLNELGIKTPTIEGHLYPETYNFDENLPADQVIRAMVREFNRKTANIDFTHPKLSKEQLLTLASIVEKETGHASEREIIAGVFFNRLAKKMRLQSDPTIIYGNFETYNGNISKRDIRTPTEYNTYTLPGLPIGPIANPGIEAIKAVLNPAKHNYYYFVSKNDGTHVFSETYQQHKTAVENWQKNRKNREGKSWRNKTEDQTSTFSDKE